MGKKIKGKYSDGMSSQTKNAFLFFTDLETIRVETSKYHFLYNDAENFHFMNNENFNRIAINPKLLDNSIFLKEGEIVNISINSDNQIPLSVDMPSNVILKVIETEPGLKGNTATNALKPATVETGAKVNVPLFINEIQRYSVSGSIDVGILSDYDKFRIQDLIDSMKDKNFTDARKWIVSNLDNSPPELFRKIYDSLGDSMEKSSIPDAILIIAEYQYKSAFVADQEINFVACIVELMMRCEFK